MPIILQADPIFTFDTVKLGCLKINGFSLKVAGGVLKEFDKFRNSKPEDAIRHLITLVAYHAHINDEEDKFYITHEETKEIDGNELSNFSAKYRKHIRIIYSHAEKKEDLTKSLSDLNEVENLHKILIIKAEQHKKRNEATAKTIASISGSHLFFKDIAKDFVASTQILNAASQAFEQFKRFDNLYGTPFDRIVKDIQTQESLIKNSMSPFLSSYADIVASLQPEIDRVREIYSSRSIIDSINQANSSLANLFSEKTSLSRLSEEAASVNRLWKTEIDSIKHLSSSVEASKLAINLHYDGIAQASLLAQERLLNSAWNDLEKSVFHKTGELSGALESFKSLTEYYNSFVHSFSAKQFDIIDFPPFVSGLPPVEILIGSDLIDTISRTEAEEYIEEADNLEDEIREDIESSLEELFVHVNPEIKRLWLGAKEAMSSTNPDKKRHVVVSLREMITHILHAIAPDVEVRKWTTDPSYYHEGRLTREARLLFVCRDINHGPFKEFVNKDVESHIKFIRLFQKGTHELNINFTDQQIRTLIVRSEALARFLLITWKNTI